jgi:hypothetical protein
MRLEVLMIPRIHVRLPLAVLVVMSVSSAAVEGQRLAAGPVAGGASRAEVAPGITMETPADVNVRPLCEQLALPCGSPRTFPDFGLILSTAVRLSDRVMAAGEIAGFANHWFDYAPGCSPAVTTGPASCSSSRVNQVRTALAGVRVRTPALHPDRREARLFAQILWGEGWSSIEPSAHVWQPGGGVVFYGSRGIAVQLEADYLVMARHTARDLSTGRLLIGVVIPVE